MAYELVVYDADKAKASIDGMLPASGGSAVNTGGYQVGGSLGDIQKTKQKIKDLEEGRRTNKYLGLSN